MRVRIAAGALCVLVWALIAGFVALPGVDDGTAVEITPPTSESRDADEASAAERPPPSEDPADEAAEVGDPVWVQVPAIDVDSSLIGVGLEPDGAMELPDFGEAAWCDLGPRPGEPGPAVVVAHVDSRDGPDVFYRLRELTPGDEVDVDDEHGRTHRFVVTHQEETDSEELPVDRIWNDTDQPVLRLITCGGEFDPEARSYESNVIVYAEPVG